MPLPRPRIAPSILSADFARLSEEVLCVEGAGADQIHIDVMDGHFVDNITMGPLVVRALRKVTRLPLDVHLMITDPRKYLEPFIDAGADHISFHVEADSDVSDCISYLRSRSIGVGVAVSPDTPVGRVLEIVPRVDMILIMTVYPGFGGQRLIPETLEKVRAVRETEASIRAAGDTSFRVDVQVDGGIDAQTIGAAADAGADVFVAGSSIFAKPDPARALSDLRERIARAG